MPLHRRLLAGAALLCALLVPAGTAGAVTSATLHASLQRWTAKLGPSSGAYVMDLTTGRELFARRADTARSPASNEKIFTTATALLRFGARGTLTTSVKSAPGVALGDDGVLHGDLYLVGGGDPSLNDVAMRSLVAQLKAAGLERIAGGVVGDDSYFDAKRGSFDSGFGPDGDLGGWLGGLTWGHGRALPGGPAAVAAARLQYFLKGAHVKAARKARAGRVPTSAPSTATQTTVAAGAAQAGSDGIEDVPATTLASVKSPPMATLITTTNQPSDNFYAETLLKDLGARFGSGGTTAAGVRVVKAQLEADGIAPTIVDGSGLSRADRVTPRQLVTFLGKLSRSALGSTFMSSLAMPGRIGTLATRMRGTAAVGRCPAKTGTLHGVSALSGYCHTLGGDLVAFSFIENNVSAIAAKRIEDRMVPVIARFDDAPPG